MRWRLGVDLGSNSLGWAALMLDDTGKPCRILGVGSRIFSDGRDAKSGTSLAVDRRNARAMSRRRDRFKQRQTALLKYLRADGLFPDDPEEAKILQKLDPYELRARALDERLSLYEVGRAVFHLNQRRGFKSNRKTKRSTEDDVGKIAAGVDRLKAALSDTGARTLGEFLCLRRRQARNQNSVPSVRTRLRPEQGDDAKGSGYDFYPGRDLVEEEFCAILASQREYHPKQLTDEVCKRLFEIVFSQRPLKAPPIGTCTLVLGEPRLPKAHPLFQRRRLLEEVNALKVVRTGEAPVGLTHEQRDMLLLKLRDSREVTFKSMRKLLKLAPDVEFNKEGENRPKLKGDEVAAVMASRTRFGQKWHRLSVDEQWTILSRLLRDEDNEELLNWLTERCDVDAEKAQAIADAPLPKGYGRFGETATSKLIAALENEVIVYSEAVERAGLGHHSDFRTEKVFDQLPYYGVALERHIMPGTANPDDPEEMRIGRITNPSVHIGLNQLRRVVNRLIQTYGKPMEIAIELARDLKLSEEAKKRLNRRNAENRRAAEKRSRKLLELNQPDTGFNRALLRLWEELNPDNCLDRRCVYTGRQVSPEMLFSGAVEVDHILPFDATLDDSNANKILCVREANRAKGKMSPFQRWGHTERWAGIAERASRLPKSKRWRFQPDAMERFDADGGFLARHLKDTQYLSRLAREYLGVLYPRKDEGRHHVWTSPGTLTAMVRRKLGLNDPRSDHDANGTPVSSKNRQDHRHHAIDAVVVAIIDIGLLSRVSRASGKNDIELKERIKVPEPWLNFRGELRDALGRVVTSHRPDHGSIGKSRDGAQISTTAGKLHNETAYGFTGETDERGNTIVVHRIPLTNLKKPADLAKIRCSDLKAALYRFTEGLEGKPFEKAVGEFPVNGPVAFRGIRRVRIVEPLGLIPIKDGQGNVYKGYKGDSNYRYDVWELPSGKWITRWVASDGRQVSSVLSMFDAHQMKEQSRPHPAARKVLSLYQNDLIAVNGGDGERRLMRVVKFGQNGQITLAPPNEGGDLKRRNADPDDPFKYVSPTAGGLKKIKARQVRIDELGRVFDPGFAERV